MPLLIAYFYLYVYGCTPDFYLKNSGKKCGFNTQMFTVYLNLNMFNVIQYGVLKVLYLFSTCFISLVPIEDLRIAEDKFDESKDLCCNSMMNLLEGDVS
jgi:hypothetical protein